MYKEGLTGCINHKWHCNCLENKAKVWVDQKQYDQRPLGIKSDQRKSNNTLHIDYLAHLPYGQDSSFNFGIALGCQHIGMTGRS